MAVADQVKDPAPMGFLDQVRSFARPFWFANLIELFERWSYYGVRAILSLYIVDAITRGGLEFNHIQKGTVYAWWAVIQSLLPMFTGGFADRYGYKKSIAVSLSISISAYLLMAAQAAGFLKTGPAAFPLFFFACMMLATGTAIFKPGVQGTLVNSTNEQNSSLGWGFFYMLVNIGGFVGPWVSGYLRAMEWKYVFVASACFLAVNFFLLLGYKDIPVEKKEAIQHESALAGYIHGLKEFFEIIVVSVKNVFEPRLITFLLIFSGFWLMFMQLFDILPNFIDDWVNSSMVLTWLGTTFHHQGFLQMGQSGQNIPPEWMINLDAGSIVLFMLPIAWLCGR
ncbi:MAG: MFS transporter, partial [Bacteroidota bacterium]